jgi:hypothetical protein
MTRLKQNPERDESPELIGGSKAYHRRSCKTVDEIRPWNRRNFSSCEEAAESGLRPCHICKPPIFSPRRDRAEADILTSIPDEPITLETLTEWCFAIRRLIETPHVPEGRSSREKLQQLIQRRSRDKEKIFQLTTASCMLFITYLRETVALNGHHMTTREMMAAKSAWDVIQEWVETQFPVP